MSDTSRKRRSARQAQSRKRSIYAEHDTDTDEFDISDDFDDVYVQPTKRRKTATRTRPRDLLDDDEDELAGVATPPRAQKVHVKRRRRSTRKVTVGEEAVKKVSTQARRPKKRRLGRPLKARSSPSPKDIDIPSDGVQPPWPHLPYEILLQIFGYANSPGSHTWLLQTARKVCKAFSEPALTAFYQRPRLPSPAHLENLRALADKQPGTGWINYAVKVRSLELDIHAFVHRKEDEDSFELAELVARLPKLEEVLITSDQDKPPYRRHALPRWRYPNALFDALDKTDRQLRSWRWNWLFVRQTGHAPRRLYDLMCHHHQSPALHNVRHLEISDHPEFVTSEADEEHHEDKIAEAISLLPNLRSLELETCDIVNARFLVRLPKSLTSLRLANCEALTSDAIEDFLSQDGGCQLESLILDHNVRLDLAFLPLLGTNCLKLKVLSMDLHYYSQHHTVNDADARYKHLLAPDHVPTWPASIERIEMQHLQKWSAEGAQSLFKSLLDSAEHLPNLRSLILNAHISISWRDRASFREQWIDRLSRVFLRKSKDPSPDLASLKAFRLAKGFQRPGDATEDDERALSGVEVHRKDLSEEDFSGRWESDEGEAVGPPVDKTRRSKRIANVETQRAALASRRATDTGASESSEDSEDSDEWAGATGLFRQGLCHTVDIKIDNQRPREEKFTESHFLDSEQSGDDDWREDGDEVVDDGYAW